VAAEVSDRSRVQDRILSAAMKLYNSRGYQATSFNAICQTASLPEHVVRTHYRDETQVFSGVLDRVREAIEKIAKAPETAQERLVAFVHGMS
tara:strand:+ start:168 stop:443 length:276 start_codon:yes stop_codon:yes gene_type:complete